MNISTQQFDDNIVLGIKEERLDANNSMDLKEHVLTLLNQGHTKFVIDLSDVLFVDSSGLGVLLSGYKNVSLKSGRFSLVGLHQRVQSMFELTRLHRVFDIYPNLEEALNHA